MFRFSLGQTGAVSSAKKVRHLVKACTMSLDFLWKQASLRWKFSVQRLLNPALFFGLSDSLGTIEAGKIANLVLLDGNPLQEIRNTNRIVAVISEGRLLDRKALNSILTATTASP